MYFFFFLGQRVLLNSVTTRGSNIPLFYKSFSKKPTSLLTNYNKQKNTFQNSYFYSINTRFTIKPLPPIGTAFNGISIRFKSYKMKTHSGVKKR
jgi:hypothetical protein